MPAPWRSRNSFRHCIPVVVWDVLPAFAIRLSAQSYRATEGPNRKQIFCNLHRIRLFAMSLR